MRSSPRRNSLSDLLRSGVSCRIGKRVIVWRSLITVWSGWKRKDPLLMLVDTNNDRLIDWLVIVRLIDWLMDNSLILIFSQKIRLLESEGNMGDHTVFLPPMEPEKNGETFTYSRVFPTLRPELFGEHAESHRRADVSSVPDASRSTIPSRDSVTIRTKQEAKSSLYYAQHVCQRPKQWAKYLVKNAGTELSNHCIHRWIDLSIDWLIDCSIVRSIYWLISWLIDWINNAFQIPVIGLLVACLIDWMSFFLAGLDRICRLVHGASIVRRVFHVPIADPACRLWNSEKNADCPHPAGRWSVLPHHDPTLRPVQATGVGRQSALRNEEQQNPTGRRDVWLL